MKIKVLVRTWHKVPDRTIENVLKSVWLPISVIERVDAWAVEQQFNLLHRKYIDLPRRSDRMSPQWKELSRTMNKLWKEIQREGINSPDELLAVPFLFRCHEDNPEGINLAVTKQFLESLSQEVSA